MVELSPGGYLFVVDTEQYAGNFERQMCAWMTSIVGECGVGKEIARSVLGQIDPKVLVWLNDHVDHRSDEHGCSRPVTIFPTPGWWNDGMGTHHRDDCDIAAATATYLASVEKYAIQAEKGYADKCDGKDAAEKLRMTLTAPGRFPAYQSVAIFVSDRPPPEVVAELKARALSFPGDKWTPKPTITGFRVLHQVTTFEMVDV